MTDIQDDSSETTTPQEPSNPLPKGKAGSWDRSRLLTPSELKSLKEDMAEAHRISKGRFKDLT